MRKYITTLFVTLGLSGILSGCGADFLEKEPTQYISGKKIAELSQKDPKLAEGNLSSMYAILTKEESGGLPGNQEDYGQKSMDLIFDMLIGDICKPVAPYGWYTPQLQYNVSPDYSNLGNYMPWRYYYRIILAANELIESLGGRDAALEGEESTSARHFLGQALAMRANSYFYLLQYYTPKYEKDGLSVSLYLSKSDVNMPLVAQDKVYAEIFADLDRAIKLLDGFENKEKTQIDQNVAKGILAYANAAVGNYNEVKRLTDEIIATNKYRQMSKTEVCFDEKTKKGGGFNDIRTPGWMWGADIDESAGLDLVSFWGHMDVFYVSYPSVGEALCISDALYGKIREDDVRKAQFGSVVMGSGANATRLSLIPNNKFFNAARKIQGQRKVIDDYVFMRISEMILLNVEAKAFLNDESGAKATLKNFLKERITDTAYVDGLSGDALKEEIQTQWRIEFWGEGKAFLAHKRFGKDVVLGKNRFDVANQGITIPFADKRLYYKVPKNERDNNPNIPVVPSND